MSLGRRPTKPTERFIPTAQLRSGPGHPFSAKLHAVRAAAGLDTFTEKLCAPYYKDGGRPGIPPGTYFRLLFSGCKRASTASAASPWRCAASLWRCAASWGSR